MLTSNNPTHTIYKGKSKSKHMDEKKDVYMGWVGEKKTYDSGVQKYPIQFRADQLEEMKKYLTANGSVNIDFVIKTDGGAFMSVWNPRHPDNAKYANSKANQTTKAAPTAGNDLPF